MRAAGSLYEVRYEDLLDHPRTHIPAVFAFLGEPALAPEVLDEVCAIIKPGNYGKWKQRMNAAQIALFEAVAADTLKRFGYEASRGEAQLPALKKTVYRLADSAMWWKHMFQENVIDTIRIKFMGMEPFSK